MANIKFSQFTADGNIDGNSVTAKTGSETSFLVGYDDTGNTNNMWTFPQVAEGLPTIYAGDGNITANRTINDRAGGFATDAGNGALKMNIRNSGALMVAGYQNNGDPGTANNCFRWGPGKTAGGMDVRGNLALSSGGGAISLFLSNGTQYTTISPATVSITTTGNQEYLASAIGFGTSASANYRVRIKGATSANTGYGLQVQNSSNDEILSVRDDGVVKIGGQAYTELHTGTTPLDPDWNNGNVQESTLTSGSSDFDPTNPKAGATYILKLTQPGSGAAGTVNWDNIGAANIKWPGGTEPTLTTTNGAVDIITLICTDSTGQGVYYANATLDMQ